MAFKPHSTFRSRSIPEVYAVVEETFEDEHGNEVTRQVKKNVNTLTPAQRAVDLQLINQINAGQPIRRVSTLIDSNDRFDTETLLQCVSPETTVQPEN